MRRIVLALLFLASPLLAQDLPSFRVGALIFADYTYTSSPSVRDADGNLIHPNSFNVSRAYINVFGTLTPRLSFRVTPEAARETGSGSSLSGSQTYRVKFAYVQFNLDDWLTKGSWLRAGINQTPFIDWEEQIYRYRFQGPIFVDREGILFASDAGASFHYNFPSDYGDLHFGVYNGEGWAHSEANDQKALQLRASLRPMPKSATMKGLRFAAFIDEDHYVRNADRKRGIAQVTFEHPRANAGFDYVTTRDQRNGASQRAVDGRGYSAWVTPKLAHGWELLARRDHLEADTRISGAKNRDIEGVAYWFAMPKNVSTALMLDRDSTRDRGVRTTNFGLKLLISY